MREILFRGKRVDNGKWVYGYYLNRSNDEEDIHCIMEQYPATTGKKVIPETVGQYTGVTDRYGQKIFEGDLIRRYGGIEALDLYNVIVEWDEHSLEWRLGEYKLYNDLEKSGFYYEVIGNIHDNPN